MFERPKPTVDCSANGRRRRRRRRAGTSTKEGGGGGEGEVGLEEGVERKEEEKEK